MASTETGVEVVVRLRRRVQHHLLTTFLPTLCLMVVCQCGLYLRAEHFKTVAAISVTVMLVMYTLYRAVSQQVTATAYIKLVDVWLIFALLLPFAVFFLLVALDSLPTEPSRFPDKPQALWVLRKHLAVVARIVLPAVILLFTLVYAIVAAVLYNS